MNRMSVRPFVWENRERERERERREREREKKTDRHTVTARERNICRKVYILRAHVYTHVYTLEQSCVRE